MEANRKVIMQEAKSYDPKDGVTESVLDEAYLAVEDSLIRVPAPVREPSPQEKIAAENSRLRSLSQDQIRAELKRLHPGYAIPQDVVSPELLAMTGRKDILALTGQQLTKLMYRDSDGSRRRANEARINELLQK
jgi:hypothetical protein